MESLEPEYKHFRNLMDCVPESIQGYYPDGTVFYWNTASEKVYGYSAEEAIGKNLGDLIIPPNLLPLFKKSLEAGKGIKESGEFMPPGELILQHKNGHPVPIYSTHSAVYRKGKEPLLFCIDVDLTERKRVERDLRKKEKRFSDISENALDWIWEVDVEGRYTYASRVVEKVLGYTQEEILSKHFYDLFHPEDREERKRAAFHTFSQKKPFRKFINRNVHKNGRTIWLSTSGVPIFDENGTLLGYRGADRDITERRETEMRLSYLSSAVANIGEMVIVTDMDHEVTYANDAVEKTLGYTPEEMIGHKAAEFFEGIDGNPPNLVQWIAAQKRGEVWRGELLNKRKDGSFITVHLTLNWLRDTADKKIGTVGVSVDITERKRTEQRLLLLSTAIAQSSEGVAVSDLEGHLQFVNEAFATMHGYTVEELQGKNLSVFHTPEQMPSVNASIGQVKKTGSFSGELWHRRRDGTTFPAFMQNTLIMDESGKAICMMGACRDISDLKEAEKSLRESEEKFRLAFENARDAILWADADTGKIVMCNKAAELLFERRMDELIGHHHTDIHPPDDSEYYATLFQKHLKKKGTIDEEIEIAAQSGKVKPVHLTANVTVIRGHTLIQGIFRDITERKKAEDALRLTQFCIDRAGDPIFWLDRDGRFFYVNDAACRSLGYSRDELLSMTVHDIDTNFPREKWDHHWENLRESGFFTFESAHRAKDGRTFPVEISINHLSFGGEEYHFAFARDITDRKHSEKALRISESKLQVQKEELEHKNVALREILEQIEFEKKKIKDDVTANVEMLFPYLKKLKLKGASRKYINLLQKKLEELTSSFGTTISDRTLKLTPREIEICDMIKGGLTNKEICSLLNISVQTVETHRRSIRRKLGISRKKINLTSYLKKD